MTDDYFNQDLLFNSELSEQEDDNCEMKHIDSKTKSNVFVRVICFQTFLCVFLMAILGGLKIISPDTYVVIGQELKNSLDGPELKSGIKNIFEKVKIALNELKPIDLESASNKNEIEFEFMDNSPENDLENSIDTSIVHDNGDITFFEFKQPAHGRISSKFGKRESPLTGKPNEVHNGVDIVVGDGTPVIAMADGVITKKSSSKCFGNFFFIQHEDGYESLYAHCSEILVEPGNSVAGGQLVAKSGHSGLVTGPHLHFGIKKDGKWIDPSKIFPKLV